MDTTPPSSQETSSGPSAAPLSSTERRRRVSVPVPLLLVLTFLVGLAAGFLIWGLSVEKYRLQAEAAEKALAAASSGSGETAANTTQQQQQAPTRYKIPIEGAPSIGPADAPITLVEFSDYECPYCTKWHTEVYHRLLEEYQGKVRFVYKDFPLYSIHSNAISAAESAYCAGEQGKYWEFHDRLFAENVKLGLETYQNIAKETGLDQEKFNTCVTNRTYQGQVEASYQWAAKLGVQSTPTFFINGLAVVGAQPYEVFKGVIDKELAGEIPQ